MTRRLTAVAAVAATLLAAGPAAAQTRIDEDDDGRTVRVAHDADGTTVRIEVEQSGSAGTTWRFARRPMASVLRFERAFYVPPAEQREGEPALVGAPGRKVYVFRTRRAGRTALRLTLFGPGEGPAVEHLDVTVRVT